MTIVGLTAVLCMVLVLPFAVKKIEEELEIFLFTMGIAAALISHKMTLELVREALREPIFIAAAVFAAGAAFYLLRHRVTQGIQKHLAHLPMPLVMFLVVLVLGLLSSLITAIMAAILLSEVLILLPLNRQQRVVNAILGCFAIGLGAALTPVGEPLATIAVSRLNQDFLYLARLLGAYVVPLVALFALLAAGYMARIQKNDPVRPTDDLSVLDRGHPSADHSEASTGSAQELQEAPAQAVVVGNNINTDNALEIEEEPIDQDSWKSITIRALKVYLFVMALLFLGTGFEPLIDRYITALQPQWLYWINMISAVLDNATLCAAELSPAMADKPLTIESILLGLLISGGMLIPGNIPNIITASKLRITSTEWARLGVPLGLVMMTAVFALIFWI